MTAALILATDLAVSDKTRRQPGPKQIAPVLNRLVSVYQQAGVQNLVVVVPPSADWHTSLNASEGVTFLPCKTTKAAQPLADVKLGLSHLSGRCEQVFITPITSAIPSKETLADLLSRKACFAVPLYVQTAGFPLLLSADCFDAVLHHAKDEGALSSLLFLDGVSPTFVYISHNYELPDEEPRKDDPFLGSSPALLDIYPTMKLSLEKDLPFFGPGPYKLLCLIEQTGSLRMACTQMQLSYSKGWKIIEKIEAQLGYNVISKSRGGREHGRSEMTDKGRQLLKQYNHFYGDCAEAMYTLYLKHFGPQA